MKRTATIAGAITVLAAFSWAGWTLHEAGYLSRQGVIDLADRSGSWAPMLVIGAMVLAVVIGPIPTVPITVASGAMFGAGPGFAYATLGALLGAWISFGIGRAVGQRVVQRLFRGHASFCPACSTRLLFWAVLAARLVPVISFAAVSYGAGLTAMRVGAFLLATAVGMIPMTLVYVVVGAAVRIDPVIAGIFGTIIVVLLAALPRLAERFNILGLRRVLPHDTDGSRK